MNHFLTLLILLLLLGAGCLIAGVYLLAGTGFALIAVSVVSLAAAFTLRRGLTIHG